MKKIFLALAFVVAFTIPHSVSAASLTEPQIQAILGLLQAFDVPQATIENVNTILHGNSSSTAAPRHIRGLVNAKVVLVEYCDTESPFCKTFHSTMRDVYDTYERSELAWEYRSFPLSQIFSKSEKEARALECAADLGGNDAFWEYTDKLYDITPSDNGLDPAKLSTIATGIGLSRSAFEKCLVDETLAPRVQRQYNEGIMAGVQGTPSTLLIKGGSSSKLLNGAQPLGAMKAAIDALLQ